MGLKYKEITTDKEELIKIYDSKNYISEKKRESVVLILEKALWYEVEGYSRSKINISVLKKGKNHIVSYWVDIESIINEGFGKEIGTKVVIDVMITGGRIIKELGLTEVSVIWNFPTNDLRNHVDFLGAIKKGDKSVNRLIKSGIVITYGSTGLSRIITSIAAKFSHYLGINIAIMNAQDLNEALTLIK